MPGAAWLLSRELRGRWRSIAVLTSLVAVLAGAGAALDLLGRARDEAVAAGIDAMGPALTIVPPEIGPDELARGVLGDGRLQASVIERVPEVVGSDLRAAEPRLVGTRTVAGLSVPVIGSAAWTVRDGVLVGAELARRLEGASELTLDGHRLRVQGVRPPQGDVEDFAVLVPLSTLDQLWGSAGAVNVLRLYLRAGVSALEVERRLSAAGLEARVVRHDRGEVAGHDLQAALTRYGSAARIALFLATALCLLAGAHLDASERRSDLATLLALGAPRSTIAGALVSRSALVASVGASLGVGAAFAIAAAQDGSGGAAALGRYWLAGATTVAVSTGLAVLAASPTAASVASRDPVGALQED
jgi:hypothetical protein